MCRWSTPGSVPISFDQRGTNIHTYNIHTSPDNSKATFVRMTSCINEIGHWMSSNRLKLNTDKTQFTCLGTRYQLAKVDTAVFIVNCSTVNILRVVTCLGVIIDQELTFSDHIRSLAGRCLYWLIRQLRSIRRTLTTETITALVNALVISGIDYSNAVLTGVHDIH